MRSNSSSDANFVSPIFQLKLAHHHTAFTFIPIMYKGSLLKTVFVYCPLFKKLITFNLFNQ
jgi:hypothetical protein